MKRRFARIALLLIMLLPASTRAQGLNTVADSLVALGNIPELGYAIVMPDSIPDIYVTGYHRADKKEAGTRAGINDYFHLGSNTKAITSFIAAWLVEQKKLSWDTRFFDLFPEWKKASDSSYYNMTLEGLLSHRARIQPFTAGLAYKLLPPFTGTTAEKRSQFVQHILKGKPVKADGKAYHYSNAGYSVATLMLEKVSGKTWEQLVHEVLKERLKLNYMMGWPNDRDTPQPWGHWAEGTGMKPLTPDHEYNLALTEPAGDISMPLPDYAKFIQLHLQGLSGRDNFLKAETYKYMHTALAEYSMGWLNATSPGKNFSNHAGSAGTFYCVVSLDRDAAIGYIAIGNSGTDRAQDEIIAMLRKMRDAYPRRP